MSGQTNVLFVNFEYLKKNSPIYENIDEADILWIIPISQDMRMERILGSKLYNKLKTEVINGTISGVYKTLLDDYIIPSLIYFIVLDAIDFNTIKFTNKGLVRKTSENSELASIEEIRIYKNKLETFAEYYSQRIIDFLCANNIEEYLNPGNTIDTIYPKKNGYKTTIYIPGRNNKRIGFDYN